ncbi:MAG: DUF4192 domain-containing protein [Actinomycetia bacterium]|nr:DUF4192 domain-containing protein [Actinomycetes bacterium]
MTSPITLRAYSTDDQLAAIPVLLGFHPSSSLVLALIVDGCMGPLLRADLVDALRPEPLHRLLSSLENRVAPDCGLYIVVYGDDRDQLRRLALEVERKASLPVSESVIVCGGRWWHTYATDDDPGRPYCPQSSPVAAEAAYLGLPVLASRADLERYFEPPRGQRRVSVRTLQAARQQVRATPGRARALLTSALGEALAQNPRVLPGRQLALLLALAEDPTGRLAFWSTLNQETAQAQLGLWLQVARRFTAEQAVVAVCLAGFAAWQCGNGALLAVASHRAAAAAPQHEVVKLLRTIDEMAVPPRELETVRRLGLLDT